MSNILEGMRKYFESTSREQVLADWAKYEKYSQIGPPVRDFIRDSMLYYELDTKSPDWEFQVPTDVQNPEFSSDFFYNQIQVLK